jgi:2'-5' RNA ligase
VPETTADKRARVFFALWPDRQLQDALGALAQHVQAQCGGRATPAEKTHITLFFVGSMEREGLRALEASASQVSGGGSFDLELDTLGYWKHNRIAWVGVSRCPGALLKLATDLRQRLVAHGLSAEDRPYVPHVTIVRNASRAPQARRISPLRWRVHDFALVESTPTASGGVRYDVMRRWPLA